MLCGFFKLISAKWNEDLFVLIFNAVSISYANYRAVHPSLTEDDEEEVEDEVEDSDEDDGKSENDGYHFINHYIQSDTTNLVWAYNQMEGQSYKQ